MSSGIIISSCNVHSKFYKKISLDPNSIMFFDMQSYCCNNQQWSINTHDGYEVGD